MAATNDDEGGGGGGGGRSSSSAATNDDSGPRAAMEVGRKQVIYFCYNVQDEQPDPTMLAEVKEDEEM